MTAVRKYLFTLIVCLLTMAAGAQKPAGDPLPGLKAQLARAKSPADSVKILYNIYDLVERTEKPLYGRMIFQSAGRAYDYAAQNDILRQLASLYSASDSALNLILKQAEKLPNSVDSRVTGIFVKNQQMAMRSKGMNDNERKNEIIRLINEANQHPDDDIYSKIDRTYAICNILGRNPYCMLYMEMIENAGKLVEQLPSEGMPIRNQYYTAVANICTYSNHPKEAIAADRKLLKIIDGLEKDYKAKGRIYRRYNTSRYVCYRRMLQNYHALSRAEVEEIYKN